MAENFEINDLENLVIKDKNYYREKRKKVLLISIPIIITILLLTAIAIILIFVLKPKPENKIICYYQTLKPNENISLLNIKDDIYYNLIIDDINYGKANLYQF